MVLAAECRNSNDSHVDFYQYFFMPEYGTANVLRHVHAVHFMRTLLIGSVDRKFGRRVRNRRQLSSLQNTWCYGYSMHSAVRYRQDAFSFFFSCRRRHTRWPRDWSSDVCSSDLGRSLGEEPWLSEEVRHCLKRRERWSHHGSDIRGRRFLQ